MKKLIFTLSIAFSVFNAYSQEFLPPIENYSVSKKGYLITKKDEKITFTLRNVKINKKVITGLNADDSTGKKFTMMAEDIKVLALPPSNFGKLTSTLKATNNINKIEHYNGDSIYKKEYVYFLSNFVEGKEKTALLQLLNPNFSSRISVFHDPFATETTSLGLGGVALVGGDDKSYYVKYKDKTIRLKKKFYDDKFSEMYGDCPAFMEKYKTKPHFSDLAEHVYFYDQNCK